MIKAVKRPLGQIFARGALPFGLLLVSASLSTPVYANGTVSGGTTTVSRTSKEITLQNPTPQIRSVHLTWDENPKEISLTATNAFFVNTPFSLDVTTNAPIEEGQSITLPLEMSGEIFNSASHYLFPETIGQNNGNFYLSSDHNFTYDYNTSAKELTITAKTSAHLTEFKGLTYFLNNAWVPVPLTKNPYPLSGGIAGNYGEKGSGATLSVSLGNQTTSETVTNTAETNFSSEIVPDNGDFISRGNGKQSGTASSSNNFLSCLSQALYQSKVGKDKDVLDGSVDHYVVTPIANAQLTPQADLYKNLRLEQYFPIGSNQVSHSPIDAFAGGLVVGDYPAYKQVFKALKYDEKSHQLSFDLSRNPKDWGEMAQALLADPHYYNGQPPEWNKAYLEEMAKGENAPHETPDINLYLVSPQAYAPINPNFPLQVEIKATNSKTGKSATQEQTVNPVNAGSGSQTMAGLQIQTVDETGKAIGQATSPTYYDSGQAYALTPPKIPGYQWEATNPSDLIQRLKIPDVVNAKGTIQPSQIGKNFNVIEEYAQEAPILYSVVDDTTGKTLQDKTSLFTGLVGHALNTPEHLKALQSLQKEWEAKHYQVAQVEQGNLPTPSTAQGYTVVFHLTHSTTQRTVAGPQHTVTQTIYYSGAGDKTPKAQIQSFSFTSTLTQTVDEVTQAVIHQSEPQWSGTQESQAISSPEVAGYLPNQKVIAAHSYTHDAQDETLEVAYKAQASTVNILYRDIDPRAKTPNELIERQELKGVTDAPFDHQATFNQTLEKLKAKGYLLVQADSQKGQFPVGKMTLVVDLKHEIRPVPDYQEKDVTQRIDYVNEKGEKVFASQLQVLHFVNGAAVDQVTKEDVKDNWSESQQTVPVRSPKRSGYRPDSEKIGKQTYTHASKDQTFTVTYKAKEQVMQVRYIDVEGLKAEQYFKGKPLKAYTEQFVGKSDQPYDHATTVQKSITQLKNKGYQLEKMSPRAMTGQFGHQDEPLEVVPVYLSHQKETVLGGKPTPQGQPNPAYHKAPQFIVRYQGAGENTPKAHCQTLKFEAKVTYDQVRDAVVQTKWNPNQTAQTVTTPPVKGYVADESLIKGQPFSPKSQNQVFTVHYRPKGSPLPTTGEKKQPLLLLLGVGLLLLSLGGGWFIIKKD